MSAEHLRQVLQVPGILSCMLKSVCARYVLLRCFRTKRAYGTWRSCCYLSTHEMPRWGMATLSG